MLNQDMAAKVGKVTDAIQVETEGRGTRAHGLVRRYPTTPKKFDGEGRSPAELWRKRGWLAVTFLIGVLAAIAWSVYSDSKRLEALEMQNRRLRSVLRVTEQESRGFRETVAPSFKPSAPTPGSKPPLSKAVDDPETKRTRQRTPRIPDDDKLAFHRPLSYSTVASEESFEGSERGNSPAGLHNSSSGSVNVI